MPWQQAPDPFATSEIQAAAARKIQLFDRHGYRTEGGLAVLIALNAIGWHTRLTRLGQHKPMIWAVEVGYAAIARLRGYL